MYNVGIRSCSKIRLCKNFKFLDLFLLELRKNDLIFWTSYLTYLTKKSKKKTSFKWHSHEFVTEN